MASSKLSGKAPPRTVPESKRERHSPSCETSSQQQPSQTVKSGDVQKSTLITDRQVCEALLDSAICVAATDAKGRVLLANEAFCRIIGLKEGDLLPRDWLSIARADDKSESDGRRTVRPRRLPIEKRCVTKDGGEIWLRCSISLQRSGDSAFYLWLIEDITALKRAEQALAENVLELQELQRLGQMGSWQWDPKTDAVSWSRESYVATGYDPKLPAPTYKEHSRFFTPEDWARLTQSVDRTLKTGEPYELELEVIRQDGGHGWIITRGEAVRDARGQVIRLRGTIIDISELRRAEEALRSAESRAALYFQQTMFAVVEWDRHFRVVEWNPAAESMFGYTRAEALGRHPVGFILPVDIDPRVEDVFNALMSRTGGQLSVNENIRKDGTKIVCEWFNTPMVGEDGSITGVVSLAHDVTVSKQAQSQLAESQATLSAIVESTEDMVWVVDPERFGLTMFNGGLARYFAQYRNIQIKPGMTPDELLPTPASAELWKSFYRRALREGAFRQEYDTVSGIHILDLSFYPLIRDGQIFGISVFGENVTESRRTERALQQSEDRYRHLVEASNDWVWQVDAQANYTYVGPQCQEVLGYAPEEILGRNPFDLMPKAEALRVAEVFGAIASQRRPFRALENVNLHKDGHLVVLETNGGPIFDGRGNFAGYQGMDRDITERKRAETALRESEAKYRTLADNLPGVVFQFYARENGDQGFYFIHENSRELLGIEAEPFDTWGKRVATCLEPDDLRRGLAAIQQAIASDSTFDFETKVRKPKGEEIYIRGLSRPQRHGNELIFHGILLDITARKRAERALRESEERLRLAAQASRMYAFEWDTATDAVTRSEECIGILGLTRDWMQAPGKLCRDRMHPQDREQYADVIASLTPDSPTFRINYRFARPDGVIWLEDHGRAFFDDHGVLLRTVGMTADITARKETEIALNEVSGRLINAQEEERKRIARELHDGMSQELALISIETAQAAKAATEAQLRSKLDKLYARLQTIASGINHLSHELHPSTLKHLGLASAIRVLCEEISQGHGIEIDFTDRNVPQAVSKETALCLYRIVQECLRNVVKHSQSKRAWVKLSGDQNGINVHIWDQGIGFSTHSRKAGLGFISMRERLRLVGGKIVISSRRGSGTRIEAYAPLECKLDEAAA